MAEKRVQRRLAAILAADVAGYSRMMGADEAGTRVRLNDQLDAVIRPSIESHHGRLVKTMGDGLLVEFASVLDAVQCAADIESAIVRRERAEPEERRMLYRIGIHLGDVIVEGEDIHGDGVNIAARLQTLAEPGGICVSGMVYEGVRNKLSLAFADLGERPLKNIADPVHVFRVVLDAPGETVTIPSDTLFRRPAVAVLPFENLSGDPEQEYFADGLTEDIITTLSLWRSFPVIARNSTFTYKGRAVKVQEVAKELGARYVIEGSVRRSGNRVRVTAQLINAETGHHVWAERYDRDLSDVFELQDELTLRISGIVAPELEHIQSHRVARVSPSDLDAYDFVLRGMAELNALTVEGNAAARDYFSQAIELDPSYSRGYSGLARSYLREAMLGSRSIDEVLEYVYEAAWKAVDLDGSDSFSREILGITCMLRGEFDAAVAEGERAVQSNPSNASAYANLGYNLTIAGKPEEGVRNIRRGLDLTPKDPLGVHYLGFLAIALYCAERYEDASKAAEDAIRRRPDLPRAYIYLATSLGARNRSEEARAALKKCEQISPGYTAKLLSWTKFKQPSDRDHFLDGLRKAGFLD